MTFRQRRRVRRAVRWATRQVGTVEVPRNSNRGRTIDKWQRRFGMLGQPWCGAFVGFALRKVGVKVTNRIVYTPYILFDAREGKNGFRKFVPCEQIRKGDLVLMRFPGGSRDPVHHVGIATHAYRAGWVRTVEGNTSSGNQGSQDNGGGVYRRNRPASVIVGGARPRW